MKQLLENLEFETTLIHAGQDVDSATGSLSTPIYQTSTFCFNTVEQGSARFAGEEEGYIYSRLGNPTTVAVEKKIAAIEGAEAAIATSSGMGAISSVFLGLLKKGDHIISGDVLYGATDVMLRKQLPELGITTTFVDVAVLSNIEDAILPNTKMVYFETPTNPTMKLADIQKISNLAHKHNIKVVVDSTFAPPPVQFPIKLGADFVVHSVTKYINGHGDVVGGVIVGKQQEIKAMRKATVEKLTGSVPSPFDSWLVLRGMKTLNLRVERHCENALELAKFLETREEISNVYYPGLESHPQYELAKAQMNGLYTGIISFELKDGINGLSAFDAGKKLLHSLSIPKIAVSLGDPDTLIQHPASMTHGGVGKKEKEAVGITDGLIRLSVGLENIKDLINDFDRALTSL